MKKIILLLIAIIIYKHGFAQNQSCGTSFSQPIDYEAILEQQSQVQSKPVQQTKICVDVVVHILQNSSSIYATPPSDANLIMNNLNNAFNQHLLFFSKKSTNIITSDVFYDVIESEEGPLANNYNDPNALNIYIVNSLEGAGGTALDLHPAQ